MKPPRRDFLELEEDKPGHASPADLLMGTGSAIGVLVGYSVVLVAVFAFWWLLYKGFRVAFSWITGY